MVFWIREEGGCKEPYAPRPQLTHYTFFINEAISTTPNQTVLLKKRTNTE